MDCNLIEIILAMLTCVAVIASAIAVYKANEIAKSLQQLQKRSITNHDEVKLTGQILEKLNIYNTWCKEDSLGSTINFHDGDECSYDNRDKAESNIPKDVKILIIKLASHSEELELNLTRWEKYFILCIGDDFFLKEDLIIEKIKHFRKIRESIL